MFVQNRIPHPNYVANPRSNDIGLLFLNADLDFDRFVQPIALPALGGISQLPYENEQGGALGFGGFPGGPQNQEILQAAFMRVVPPARCQLRHPQHAVVQQFCGEDVRVRSDICSDDISGPFVTTHRGEDILTGISSIHTCHTNIAVASEPSLFTRVSFYRLWINQQTQV